MSGQVQCDQCGESFGNNFKLGQHRRFKHGGRRKLEKPTKPEKERKPPAARSAGTNGSAIPAAIEELQAKRQIILEGIPELKEIDDLIERLEKQRTNA